MLPKMESLETSPICSHHRATSLFSTLPGGPGLGKKEKPATVELPLRENEEAGNRMEELEEDECFGERPPVCYPRPKGHELDRAS